MFPSPFSLTELAAAQQTKSIFAFALTDDTQQLARLQRIYARKRAEMEAVLELLDESTPDLILRAADGRQVAVRLSRDGIREVRGGLYEALCTGLRLMEEEIIDVLVNDERNADFVRQNAQANDTVTIEAAILALCAPDDPALAAYAAKAPLAEQASADVTPAAPARRPAPAASAALEASQEDTQEGELALAA